MRFLGLPFQQGIKSSTWLALILVVVMVATSAAQVGGEGDGDGDGNGELIEITPQWQSVCGCVLHWIENHGPDLCSFQLKFDREFDDDDAIARARVNGKAAVATFIDESRIRLLIPEAVLVAFQRNSTEALPTVGNGEMPLLVSVTVNTTDGEEEFEIDEAVFAMPRLDTDLVFDERLSVASRRSAGLDYCIHVFAGDYYLQHNGNYGAGLNKDDWVDMEFAGLMLPYEELALTYHAGWDSEANEFAYQFPDPGRLARWEHCDVVIDNSANWCSPEVDQRYPMFDSMPPHFNPYLEDEERPKCCVTCQPGVCPPGPFVWENGCCVEVVGGDECEAGTFLDAANLTCSACPDGTYSPDGNRFTRCLGCPEGDWSCAGGILATTDGSLWCTAPELTGTTPEVISCPWPHACATGGPCGVCEEGYGGERCGTCEAGHYLLGDTCRVCPDNAGPLAAMVAGGMVLLLLLLGCMARRPPRNKSSLVSLFLSSLTFLQVTSIFDSFSIPWPPLLSRLFGGLSFFSLNVDLVAIGPACVSDSANDPLLRVAIYTLVLPLAIPVCTLVGWLVICCVRRGNSGAYASFAVRFNFLFLTFGYIFFASKALDVFDCVPIGFDSEGDTRMVLEAYPSITCSLDDRDSDGSSIDGVPPWAPLLIMGTAAILLWIVIFPMLVMCKLIVRARRKRLDEEKTIARYGVFFAQYKRENYLWELVVLLRKLSLSAAVTILAAGGVAQVIVSVAVLGLTLVVFAWKRPFKDKVINNLETFLQLSSLLTLLGGLLLATVFSDPVESAKQQAFLDVALTVVLLLTLLVVLIAFAVIVRSEYKASRLMCMKAKVGVAPLDSARDRRSVYAAGKEIKLGSARLEYPANGSARRSTHGSARRKRDSLSGSQPIYQAWSPDGSAETSRGSSLRGSSSSPPSSLSSDDSGGRRTRKGRKGSRRQRSGRRGGGGGGGGRGGDIASGALRIADKRWGATVALKNMHHGSTSSK